MVRRCSSPFLLPPPPLRCLPLPLLCTLPRSSCSRVERVSSVSTAHSAAVAQRPKRTQRGCELSAREMTQQPDGQHNSNQTMRAWNTAGPLWGTPQCAAPRGKSSRRAKARQRGTGWTAATKRMKTQENHSGGAEESKGTAQREHRKQTRQQREDPFPDATQRDVALSFGSERPSLTPAGSSVAFFCFRVCQVPMC